VLLFLAFGSVVLPLKAIVMNVLSLSARSAWWCGSSSGGTVPRAAVHPDRLDRPDHADPDAGHHLRPVHGLRGVPAVRIRERYDQTGDNTAAVASGLQRTGGLITSLALR